MSALVVFHQWHVLIDEHITCSRPSTRRRHHLNRTKIDRFVKENSIGNLAICVVFRQHVDIRLVLVDGHDLDIIANQRIDKIAINPNLADRTNQRRFEMIVSMQKKGVFTRKAANSLLIVRGDQELSPRFE